jgi:predicted ester cyclase
MNSFTSMWKVVAAMSAGIALTAIPGHASAADESLPTPHHLELADKSAQSTAVELASLRYAAFWNTGNEQDAKQALSDDFVDRTLPAGRAPGLEGALQASRTFRAAVPDLASGVDDMTVVGDKALLHLRFKGHFTGKFKDLQGTG